MEVAEKAKHELENVQRADKKGRDECNKKRK
jgi:hypothetical protein